MNTTLILGTAGLVLASASMLIPTLHAQQVPATGDNTAAAKPPNASGLGDAVPADPWRFDFGILGWLPAVTGDVGIAGHQANVNVGVNSALDDLEGIAMLGFELGKKDYGFYAQPNWIKLGATENVGPLRADTTLNIWLVDMAGYYRIGKWGQEKPITLDALAGVRYWHVGEDLTLSRPDGTRDFQGSDSLYLIDPIVGMRTQIYLTPKFSLNLHGDFGGFDASAHSSDLCWQALGTLGYDFTPRCSLALGYRAMSGEKDNGPDGKELNLLLHGAFLALDFHW